MGQNVPNKASVMQDLNQLGPDEQKELLVESVSKLDKKTKKAVIAQAGLRSPGQKSSDLLWFIIVVSFAIVLVGTFLSLAYGVLILNKSAASSELQIILTMFTSAVAFLAGLLTPGPSHSSQPSTP